MNKTERKQLLEAAIFAAIMDEEFANNLCQWIANDNRLFGLVTRHRRKVGRRVAWTRAAQMQLLGEYAMYRRDGMSDQQACAGLASRPGYPRVSIERMKNIVSEATQAIDPSDLSESVRPIIAARKARGLKTRRKVVRHKKSRNPG